MPRTTRVVREASAAGEPAGQESRSVVAAAVGGNQRCGRSGGHARQHRELRLLPGDGRRGWRCPGRPRGREPVWRDWGQRPAGAGRCRRRAHGRRYRRRWGVAAAVTAAVAEGDPAHGRGVQQVRRVRHPHRAIRDRALHGQGRRRRARERAGNGMARQLRRGGAEQQAAAAGVAAVRVRARQPAHQCRWHGAFTVEPNVRGSRLVAHHRFAVRIRLWVTFQPTGGQRGRLGFYGLLVIN